MCVCFRVSVKARGGLLDLCVPRLASLKTDVCLSRARLSQGFALRGADLSDPQLVRNASPQTEDRELERLR